MAESERSLFVTFRVDDRAALQQVVEEYSATDADVRTITIVDPADERTEPLSIEVGHITDKQWEALEVAHEQGHYGSPRGGNLEAIAEELGISKSAASQRLRAAESKIVSAILGTNPTRATEID